MDWSNFFLMMKVMNKELQEFRVSDSMGKVHMLSVA